MGFSGPCASVFEALGCKTVPFRDGVRPQLAAADEHLVSTQGKVPVYAAGDARNGSSLVVNAIADGLACAAEVAASLA